MNSRSNVIEINVRLLRKDLTQAEIGRRAGVGRSMVNHVIKGRRKSKQVVTQLRKALGNKIVNYLPEAA